jgi:hypothetical protein
MLDTIERHGLQQFLIFRMETTFDGSVQSVQEITASTTRIGDQQHVVQAIKSALLVQ